MKAESSLDELSLRRRTASRGSPEKIGASVSISLLYRILFGAYADTIHMQKRIANTMRTARPKRMPGLPSLGWPSTFAILAGAWTVLLPMLFPPGAAAWPSPAKDRNLPSAGLAIEIPASLDDVMQALQEVLHDQIIHGTYMFEKQQTLTGAAAVDSTPLFEPWR